MSAATRAVQLGWSALAAAALLGVAVVAPAEAAEQPEKPNSDVFTLQQRPWGAAVTLTPEAGEECHQLIAYPGMSAGASGVRLQPETVVISEGPPSVWGPGYADQFNVVRGSHTWQLVAPDGYYTFLSACRSLVDGEFQYYNHTASFPVAGTDVPSGGQRPTPGTEGSVDWSSIDFGSLVDFGSLNTDSLDGFELDPGSVDAASVAAAPAAHEAELTGTVPKALPAVAPAAQGIWAGTDAPDGYVQDSELIRTTKSPSGYYLSVTVPQDSGMTCRAPGLVAGTPSSIAEINRLEDLHAWAPWAQASAGKPIAIAMPPAPAGTSSVAVECTTAAGQRIVHFAQYAV